MKHHLKRRLLSAVLVLVMVLGLIMPAGAVDNTQLRFSKVDADRMTGISSTTSQEKEPEYADTDIVRVSIILSKKPTLQIGVSTKDIAANATATAYRGSLEREQANMTAKIERVLGGKLDVKWNLTLAANLISANVPYGMIERIRRVRGVADVVLETQYAPSEATGSDTAEPQMQTSVQMSKAVEAWSNGYTGAGSRVAIIDTGVDYDHQSFSAEAFEYSLAQNAQAAGLELDAYLEKLDLLDAEEVAGLLDQLNVGGNNPSKLYINSKVPFAYNYIDENYRVSHDYDSMGEHGSHVTGIAAANTYIPQKDGTFADAYETVAVKGVAPDAQIIAMKVFGENGGAYDSDYMAAIEDAIVLGADSVNLSLGSGSAGFSFNPTYQKLLDGLQDTDTVVTMSAGNSYNWAAATDEGYLYIEDVSLNITGSPGSYSNSLSVASVESTSFNDDGTYTAPEFYTMSDFSSWGVPGSLEMKPEITAPGGNIYSVNGIISGGKEYEVMSGTSMAAPQMAGMAAVVAQYIRENDLTAKTGLSVRQLATSLLMSTAQPLLEEDSGSYYSILNQGAGMALVGNAVSAKSYILMGEDATDYAADGKVKAELGDDPERTGVYSFSFSINNISGTDLSYTLRSELFTQDAFTSNGAAFMDTWTAALLADVTYTVDGVEYVPQVTEFACDVNGDGLTNAADAQMILDYVLEKYDTIDPVADVNGDGKVSTYDAHLILAGIATGEIQVPAGDSVNVTVTMAMTEDQKATLNATYPNGAYVEAFVFAEPAAAADGEPCDVTHSIPVLGFYGNWTDPDMFGVSYSDTLYEDQRKPYFSDAEMSNNLVIERADGSETFLQVGNPYLVEEAYPEGKAAITGSDTMLRYKTNLLRNAAAMLLDVTAEDGTLLYTSDVSGQVWGAYYYVNGGAWRNTDTSYDLGFTAQELGLREGDTFTVSVTAIPEYYAKNQVLTAEAARELIASGVLGEGATLSTTMTVDNTAPVISDVDRDAEANTITITASDNLYLAALMVTSDDGSQNYFTTLPRQTEKGGEAAVTLNLDELGVSGECLIVACDYAGNQAVYEIELEGSGSGGTVPVPGGSATVFGLGKTSGYWTQINTPSISEVNIGSKTSQTGNNIKAAVYIDGYVFMVTNNDELYVAKSGNLSGAVFVAELEHTVYDLALDVANKKLYALGTGNTFYSMDPMSGDMTEEFTVTLDLTDNTNIPSADHPAAELRCLAIDDNGRFWAVNFGGSGYEFASKLYSFAKEQVVDGKLENLKKHTYITHYSWSETYTGALSPYIGGYSDNGQSLTFDYASGLLLYSALGRSDWKDFYAFPAETDIMSGDKYYQKVLPLSEGYAALYAVNPYVGLVTSATEASSLTLNPTDTTLLVGGTSRLTAIVNPWSLADQSISWSSSEESVATVANGVVTAVGAGTATITATTNAAPYLTAACTVTVVDMPVVQMNGLVYGADSQTYWSSFSSADPGSWSVINGPANYYYGGTLSDGKLYAHDGEYVYAIDPDTFDAEAVTGISSTWYWNDAAPAELTADGCFGAITVLSNSGTYLSLIYPEAGEVSYFDLSSEFSSDPMANIALYGSSVVESCVSKDDGQTYENCPAYHYYVLTEGGNLYDFTVIATPAGFNEEHRKVISTGFAQPGVSDVLNGPSSSMLYDEASGFLFLSTYVSGDKANLYAVHPASGSVANLGGFGANVWPVNSLYTYEPITELTLRVSGGDVSMYVGDACTLKATVIPTTYTGGVTFASSDENVVTVTGSGRLKAVGSGTATVTVTTVDVNASGERLSKSIRVTVRDTLDVDVRFNANLETEDRGTQWIAVDTANGMNYEVIDEFGAMITGGGIHNNKFLVGDGIMSLFWGFIPVTYLYEVDPAAGYDMTLLGDFLIDYGWNPADGSTLPAMNLTYVSENGEEVTVKAGNQHIYLAESDYLFTADVETGRLRGWSDLADELGSKPVALTYKNPTTFVDEDTGKRYEAHSYYVITDEGTLYEMTVYAYWDPDTENDDGSHGAVGYSNSFTELARTDLRFSDVAEVSMVKVDDGLVIADGAKGADIYYIDLNNDFASGKIGTLPDACGISTLYLDEEIGTDAVQALNRPVVTGKGVAAEPMVAGRMPTKMLVLPLDQELNIITEGTLNAVSGDVVIEKNHITEASSTVAGDGNTVTVTLTDEKAVTNGLLKITYDPAAMTFDSATSPAITDSVAVDAENGIIYFDYASGTAVAAGRTLAQLTFTFEGEYLNTSVTVETLERNDTLEVTDAPVELAVVQEVGGHNYEVTDSRAVTCTVDGYATYTCTRCHDTYTTWETAPGHDYETAVTEATCTEGGYTTYTCHCGDSYVDDYTDATGHDYHGVVTPPTATEGGYTTYTCANCGDSYIGDETDPLPTEPATDPSEPATDPSEPASDPSEPATDPSEPATDPSEPAADPSEPATDPSEPAADPSEPATEPVEPAAPNGPADTGDRFATGLWAVMMAACTVSMAVLVFNRKKWF